MPNKLLFGLEKKTISSIQHVLSEHPEVVKAIIYGSRAKGNHRSGSDIDLTLVGPSLTHSQLNHIETEIDDLLLPYTIDLSLFNDIENAELIEHIERLGQIFFERNP